MASLWVTVVFPTPGVPVTRMTFLFSFNLSSLYTLCFVDLHFLCAVVGGFCLKSFKLIVINCCCIMLVCDGDFGVEVVRGY